MLRNPIVTKVLEGLAPILVYLCDLRKLGKDRGGGGLAYIYIYIIYENIYIYMYSCIVVWLRATQPN